MTVSLKLVNFEEEMERVRNEVRKQANADVKERIQYATKTLRIVTPVDTGEARAGWKSTTALSRRGEVSGVISNPVEHIVYLNRGHSKQAPSYFIEQVLSTIGILE